MKRLMILAMAAVPSIVLTAAEIRTVDFAQTKITGGFWKQKQDMVSKSTVNAVYDRFVETGRFAAFRCDWKKGMPNRPHVFWDSDVAKWIEGAAYITELQRNEKLERIIDETVELIAKNQREDGYFNIVYIVFGKDRFVNRNDHELYCAGHLMEAAVAYYKATGKRKFLDCMCRYADYIEKRFKVNKDTVFASSGHEEIELALYRLYDCTGEIRYRELAEYFINVRGTPNDKEGFLGQPYDRNVGNVATYSQAHQPVREQEEAVGHAVRAVYLYCAMAELAKRNGDEKMKAACEKVFDSIVNKRMYITGGIGSSACGEAFTDDYDLSNIFAYTETCASLGLALFANRMLCIEADSKYADVIERVIYNGFISSTSLDGQSFFYENPLEVISYLHTRDRNARPKDNVKKMILPPMQRSKVFGCSCCPPNIVRFIPSIANLIYGDDGNTLYVHQFMESETTLKRGDKVLSIAQKTAYPEDGKVTITVKGGDTRVAVRIPGWCDSYTGKTDKGYAYFDVKDGESLSFDFEMKPKLIRARTEVVFNVNRVAVMRGPIVYCMESVDNGANLRDVRIDRNASFAYGRHEKLDVPMLTVKAYRSKPNVNAPLYGQLPEKDEFVETKAVLIPYYAFANRGVTEMQVWHFVK